MGASEFSTDDNLQAVREESCDRKKTLDDVKDAKFELIIKNLTNLECSLFLRAKHIGSWMTVCTTTVTGTVLTAT